jgi:hypothetical protein
MGTRRVKRANSDDTGLRKSGQSAPRGDSCDNLGIDYPSLRSTRMLNLLHIDSSPRVERAMAALVT